jgi:hypothetical protein
VLVSLALVYYYASDIPDCKSDLAMSSSTIRQIIKGMNIVGHIPTHGNIPAALPVTEARRRLKDAFST